MDLTLQRPGDHLFIRSVSEAGLQVVDDVYHPPLIVSAHEVVPDWPVNALQELELHHLERILALSPEIVLVGTGSRQAFLPPRLMMFFYENNVGIEVMNTPAACRTFNVLMSELRNAAVALIPG